jgi:hypothetical protein
MVCALSTGVGELEHHQHAMATSADQLLHIDPDSICY